MINTEIAEEVMQRDNSLELRFRRYQGMSEKSLQDPPKRVPDILYYQAGPSKTQSILENGLIPSRSLDLTEEWKDTLVLFFGDKLPENTKNSVFEIKPDPLDPNWIAPTKDESDGEYGNVWMHSGPIKEGVRLLKST